MGELSLEDVIQEWIARVKTHAESNVRDDRGEKSRQKPSWQQMEKTSREEIANFVENFAGKKGNQGEKSQNTPGDALPLWERTWKDEMEVGSRFFTLSPYCELQKNMHDNGPTKGFSSAPPISPLRSCFWTENESSDGNPSSKEHD